MPEGIHENELLKIIAKNIDDYLNNELFGDVSIREAIKFYTDKYIAHHDFTTEEEDEKKRKILDVFLNSEKFHICMITERILSYSEETEQELICATLEALTSIPDDVVLTAPVFDDVETKEKNGERTNSKTEDKC